MARHGKACHFLSLCWCGAADASECLCFWWGVFEVLVVWFVFKTCFCGFWRTPTCTTSNWADEWFLHRGNIIENYDGMPEPGEARFKGWKAQPVFWIHHFSLHIAVGQVFWDAIARLWCEAMLGCCTGAFDPQSYGCTTKYYKAICYTNVKWQCIESQV